MSRLHCSIEQIRIRMRMRVKRKIRGEGVWDRVRRSLRGEGLIGAYALV
jgi:hypothetical protein